MRLILIHTRWMILELLRQPSYIVSTLAFPSLFYAIFAIPESKDIFSSNLLLASFSCFATFGVLFLQFGVGISQERTKSWHYYLRTLPVNQTQLIIARFISAYFFAFFSVLLLVVLAKIYTPAKMNLLEWLHYFIYLAGGGLVFCLMGLSLGYFSTEKAALPIGNMIYLPLSFAGGLWKPPQVLPEFLKEISVYLPTRQYGEIIWSSVSGQSIDLKNVYFLIIYAFLFFLLSILGLRRDHNARFR
ncbi:MAG: ABC transporter permease [Bdellovibrionales bacterium]|nr:ABC transporter permease [Bdellovibrionales bacterium]